MGGDYIFIYEILKTNDVLGGVNIFYTKSIKKGDYYFYTKFYKTKSEAIIFCIKNLKHVGGTSTFYTKLKKQWGKLLVFIRNSKNIFVGVHLRR